MEYKIQDIEGIFNGEVVKNLGNSEFVIKIGENEQNLTILSMDSRGIEFILNQQYHNAKYLESGTAEMKMVVDGIPITVNMHPGMDKIVYKNSGGGGSGGAQIALKSQIPGKVVSIAVEEGASVKKGDVICTLESMKMQMQLGADFKGTVRKILVNQNDQIKKDAELIILDPMD